VVGTVVTAQTNERQLVEMIIGRSLEALLADHSDHTAESVGVAVSGLTGGSLQDLSFELHQNEVVGMTGLVGSGFEEIPYLLFGAWPCQSGRLTLNGASHELTAMTPSAALRAGIALLPADRQRD